MMTRVTSPGMDWTVSLKAGRSFAGGVTMSETPEAIFLSGALRFRGAERETQGKLKRGFGSAGACGLGRHDPEEDIRHAVARADAYRLARRPVAHVEIMRDDARARP